MSGPKKTPIPLEEEVTPGLLTGSDHNVPATSSSSDGSNGLLGKVIYLCKVWYILRTYTLKSHNT